MVEAAVAPVLKRNKVSKAANKLGISEETAAVASNAAAERTARKEGAARLAASVTAVSAASYISSGFVGGSGGVGGGGGERGKGGLGLSSMFRSNKARERDKFAEEQKRLDEEEKDMLYGRRPQPQAATMTMMRRPPTSTRNIAAVPTMRITAAVPPTDGSKSDLFHAAPPSRPTWTAPSPSPVTPFAELTGVDGEETQTPSAATPAVPLSREAQRQARRHKRLMERRSVLNDIDNEQNKERLPVALSLAIADNGAYIPGHRRASYTDTRPNIRPNKQLTKSYNDTRRSARAPVNDLSDHMDFNEPIRDGLTRLNLDDNHHDDYEEHEDIFGDRDQAGPGPRPQTSKEYERKDSLIESLKAQGVDPDAFLKQSKMMAQGDFDPNDLFDSINGNLHLEDVDGNDNVNEHKHVDEGSRPTQRDRLFDDSLLDKERRSSRGESLLEDNLLEDSLLGDSLLADLKAQGIDPKEFMLKTVKTALEEGPITGEGCDNEKSDEGLSDSLQKNLTEQGIDPTEFIRQSKLQSMCSGDNDDEKSYGNGLTDSVRKNLAAQGINPMEFLRQSTLQSMGGGENDDEKSYGNGMTDSLLKNLAAQGIDPKEFLRQNTLAGNDDDGIPTRSSSSYLSLKSLQPISGGGNDGLTASLMENLALRGLNPTEFLRKSAQSADESLLPALQSMGNHDDDAGGGNGNEEWGGGTAETAATKNAGTATFRPPLFRTLSRFTTDQQPSQVSLRKSSLSSQQWSNSSQLTTDTGGGSVNEEWGRGVAEAAAEKHPTLARPTLSRTLSRFSTSQKSLKSSQLSLRASQLSFKTSQLSVKSANYAVGGGGNEEWGRGVAEAAAEKHAGTTAGQPTLRRTLSRFSTDHQTLKSSQLSLRASQLSLKASQLSLKSANQMGGGGGNEEWGRGAAEAAAEKHAQPTLSRTLSRFSTDQLSVRASQLSLRESLRVPQPPDVGGGNAEWGGGAAEAAAAKHSGFALARPIFCELKKSPRPRSQGGSGTQLRDEDDKGDGEGKKIKKSKKSSRKKEHRRKLSDRDHRDRDREKDKDRDGSDRQRERKHCGVEGRRRSAEI